MLGHMQRLTFPTPEAAQAFLTELRTQHFTAGSPAAATLPDGREIITAEDGRAYVDAGGGTADDAGVGAMKGSGVGVVAGVIGGTIATVMTGGLALPVILGMAALGSGVGAAVGAVGGAAGVDETEGSTLLGTEEVTLDEATQAQLGGLTNDGRSVMVHDQADLAALTPVAERHGGVLSSL